MHKLAPDAGTGGGAGQARVAPQAEGVWAHKDSVKGGTGHNCGERAKLEAAKKGALLGIALSV